MRRFVPALAWTRAYQPADLRPDLAAGFTIAAMLVPQGMAYALLAGLPPEVGLYAATIPVLAYALLGTSRQLAVGPVAIVSLMTASALAPIVAEGTTGYVAAAALLALMVGIVHLALGFARLGFLVTFLSHAVLVGFTAAAALIIGFSQVKHLLGISFARQDRFLDTVGQVGTNLSETHGLTVVVAALCLGTLVAMKRMARRAPSALIVVVLSTAGVEAFGLEDRGVQVVGTIPDSLPAFAIPDVSASLVGDLFAAAMVITLVGFMESVAVAKVYARRHRYDLDPNQELIGLGAANVAAGVFGGYPVTGGFSRTAVNDAAGARTPLASMITAVLVVVTLAFFTPLLENLPRAALGAIIVVAVIGLIDVAEMRHIASVKPSDLISLIAAFAATLVLGIEIGIALAVVVSLLVVLARLAKPEVAELGRVGDAHTYRHIAHNPEAITMEGLVVVRIDAAISFVNATAAKAHVIDLVDRRSDLEAVVLDAAGINDLDAAGADMFAELETELVDRSVALHLANMKGPARAVLRRSGLWKALAGRIHPTMRDAIEHLATRSPTPVDDSLPRSHTMHRDHPVNDYAAVVTETTQFIDVREPDEVAGGSLPGAINIPLGTLPERVGELDPARRVVLLCRSGGRSTQASEYLTGQGFEDVINLDGGMLAVE